MKMKRNVSLIAAAAILAASLAGCGTNKEESGKLSLKIGS